MGRRKNFEKSRVMKYISLPRIKEFCPDEKLHFNDRTLYLMYKTFDDTYPDVGIITRKFYNRPMFEHIGKAETLNMLEKLIQANIKNRNELVNLVVDLCNLPDIISYRIEELFERYKTLKPICEIYKLCYLMPSICIALDNRWYKGKKTVIGRSFFVFRDIYYTKGEITKEEALNMDIWNDKIMKNIDVFEKIKKISCVPVKKHDRELRSDKFVNKKGEKISVKSHLRIKTQVEEER